MNERQRVLVFASNEAGRHGAGSALGALKNWGAVYGQASGRQGMSYAIPTKDAKLMTLPLSKIAEYVSVFLQYAHENPDFDFEVVKIGTGLAGYRGDEEVALASMFKDAPLNVYLHPEWVQLIARPASLAV